MHYFSCSILFSIKCLECSIISSSVLLLVQSLGSYDNDYDEDNFDVIYDDDSFDDDYENEGKGAKR